MPRAKWLLLLFVVVFSILMVLLIQTAVNFSNRKKSTRLLFFYMEFYQVKLPVINLCIVIKVFILKLNLSFLFFFSFFALCLGLFTEQTTSLMLLVVPPQGADGV